MTALLEVLGEHLPAVERDLIVAGFHLYDIGTPRLSWVELESFVWAAPPGTATHTSRTNGWNLESQNASNLAQTAHAYYGKPPVGGVRAGDSNGQAMQNLRGRNIRDIIHPQQQHDPNRQTKNLMAGATAMPLSEFKERMEQRHQQWREERERNKKAEGE